MGWYGRCTFVSSVFTFFFDVIPVLCLFAHVLFASQIHPSAWLFHIAKASKILLANMLIDLLIPFVYFIIYYINYYTDIPSSDRAWLANESLLISIKILHSLNITFMSLSVRSLFNYLREFRRKGLELEDFQSSTSGSKFNK